MKELHNTPTKNVFSKEKNEVIDLIDDTRVVVSKLLNETKEIIKNYTFISSNKLNTK